MLNSIKKEPMYIKLNLLISLWKSILKLFVGKKPPDEIKVKEILNESNVLKLTNFNKINISNVSNV